MSEEINNLKHQVTLVNRKELLIEGVKTIESFDSSEFLIETIMGHMLIRGKGLMLGKMDNDKEELSIKGEVSSIEYISAGKEKGNQSFLKRLFKWLN